MAIPSSSVSASPFLITRPAWQPSRFRPSRSTGPDGGVDLWSEPQLGGHLRTGIRFLIPNFQNPGTWPHRQITHFDPNSPAYLLHLATPAEPEFGAIAEEFSAPPWLRVTPLDIGVREK